MTHKMKFYIDRYGIHAEPVCEASEESDCRLECPEGCESWVIRRDEEGPYHSPYDLEFGIESGVKHRMVDSNGCNICDWLNDDPSLIPELYDGKELVIGEREIMPVWQGPEEGYLWKETGRDRFVAQKPEPLSVEELTKVIDDERPNNRTADLDDSERQALAVISLLKEKKLI